MVQQKKWEVVKLCMYLTLMMDWMWFVRKGEEQGISTLKVWPEQPEE